jgi:eukaryotic-like serine/threonine-protein kinase
VTEARANLVPGKQITKAVSLLEPLSSGGMGAVWLADHQGLKTRVVVKFMLVGLDSSDSARTRFSREAAAAAQVKSPHVVQMLDHGVSDDGVPFIVMEHLEGHDLGDEIEARGAVDPAKVVAIVTQVAKALSKVHAAGLLHRDIKPDNIFLCAGEEDLFVKLLDFGIAKSSAVDQGDGSLDGETKTGQIVGTPFYMSPEQVTAQKVIDHRSDLWALGVVAYEALTGQRPYDGPSFGALAVKIATGAPPKPSEANQALPPAVDLWFAKACARSAADRFSSAKEMAEAFRSAFEGVLSLPASAIANSDSGQRGALASSSGSRAAGPDASASTTGNGEFGLAATALDDSDSARKQVALGRSEAGVSVVEDPRTHSKSSPLVFVGGAVALTVAVAGVLVWTARTPPNGGSAPTVRSAAAQSEPSRSPSSALPAKDRPPARTAETPASASAVPSGSAMPSASATASVSATASASAMAHVERPVVDAGSGAPTATPPRVPATTRPVPPPTTAIASSVPPNPSAEPPPKPTAKPTSPEPDLF